VLLDRFKEMEAEFYASDASCPASPRRATWRRTSSEGRIRRYRDDAVQALACSYTFDNT